MSDEYYEINIDISDDTETNLISEIKSLKKTEIQKKDNEPLLLSDMKKKKSKNQKKKSKKIDLEIMSNGNIESLDTFLKDKEESDDEKNKDIISIDELLHDSDDDDDEDTTKDLLNTQCSNYNKLKKENNPYKKEFAEEITLLYNLLKDTNSFSKDLEETYRYLTSSKVRGMSKYTIDLANTILGATSNKIQILKEINNIKKTIQDLKLKSDKFKDEKQSSTEALASHYFKNLVNYGRSNFIREFNNPNSSKNDEDIDISKFINLEDVTDTENENYMNIIEDRLDNTDVKLRSDDADKYIQYENLGVKIKIKKCVDTNTWEFVAIDKHNQQIFDYPLPSKKSAGKVKFSPDGTYATDERGRSYSVIEYFSPDE